MAYPRARVNSLRAAAEAGKGGRVDVLLYNLAQMGAKTLEEKHGAAGLWDTVEPILVEGIKQTGLGRVEIPGEARLLFQLVRMGLAGNAVREETMAADRLG